MKKSVLFPILATFLTLGLGSAAHASTTMKLVSHDNFWVGAGDLHLNFGVDTQIVRGGRKNESLDFRLGGNYFVTDIFAPGVEFQISGGNGTEALFLPNLRAYWPLHKRFLPYALIGVGWRHFPGADLFNFAMGPGIDYLLTPNVALGIALRYDLGTGNGTYHLIRFPLNFALYFKW